MSRFEKLRYKMLERVVCYVGGQRGWASGAIMSMNEEDPSDETGRTRLPYVVKLDPPCGRLISVPSDHYNVCTAEVCFGQRSDGLYFTMCCLPDKTTAKQASKRKRRFAVGDRVACAVEDATENYSEWKAGTVLDIDHSLEESAKTQFPSVPSSKWAGFCVPYRVRLDGGATVLVHRDEHWLIRDLALQEGGVVRQGADGSRNLKRIAKRKRDDGEWQAVDHVTRQVRKCPAPDSDDD